MLHERFFFQFLSQYSSPYRQHPMRQNIKNKKVGLEKYLHITVLLSLVMLECVNDSISTGWFSSSTIIRNAFGASRKKSGLAQTRQKTFVSFCSHTDYTDHGSVKKYSFFTANIKCESGPTNLFIVLIFCQLNLRIERNWQYIESQE